MNPWRRGSFYLWLAQSSSRVSCYLCYRFTVYLGIVLLPIASLIWALDRLKAPWWLQGLLLLPFGAIWGRLVGLWSKKLDAEEYDRLYSNQPSGGR